MDDWEITKHLAEYDSPLPLQTLVLHNVKDPSLLPALLQRTPELLRLCIYRIDVSSTGSALGSIVFPAPTVPKLSLFDGPPALAAALIPTRPTSKIRLLGTLMPSSMHGELSLPLSLPPLDRQLWEALGRSMSPIQEIAIPKHFYGIDNLKTYLQDVSTLKISWCHGNWGNDLFFPGDAKDVEKAVSHLCRLWPPNPSVQRLVFDFAIGAEAKASYLDLQSQSQILQKEIVVAFPKIEQVNFLTCINWKRSPLDGLWRANVPKPKRRYLLGTWEVIRDKLVDHDGCFAAVFKRES
ncbi:hypothetical protein P691DRAFT_807301 [Macrolepiota fuliginosa MF-IS2]|uniref:Uncharacterized protein n=1 Tax=Macrolepiota fuliginosa MF-IS2 TaxID=1400762 RepID=A0A9P5X5M3_9AGAR|nr:hypothetical protein P691DRAFT_807301 [Macrolepiota fuliginosa MF-IS2]